MGFHHPGRAQCGPNIILEGDLFGALCSWEQRMGWGVWALGGRLLAPHCIVGLGPDGALRRDCVASPPADAQLKITGNHRGKAQLPQSSRPSHGLQQTQRGHDVQGPLCTCTRHQTLFPRARHPDAVLAPTTPPGQVSRTLSQTLFQDGCLGCCPGRTALGKGTPRATHHVWSM